MLLHGFFLVSLNLVSIVVAIAIVQSLGASQEKIIQLTLALFINVGIYLLVYKLMNGLQNEIMKIDDFSFFVIVLLSSLALLPTIFYPIDYLMRGSWSSIDRLLTTFSYQLFANGLCLVWNYFILVKSKL